MAPILKEPEQKNSSAPAAPAQPRVQPVALEISVTVNGARTVEGSDKREPFSETTQTVLVFGNGAVIRLNSGVTPGQLLFLTNEKTKKEVVCQVVKSKNYSSMSGYVELEFTEPAVGFWGMRFPSDRIAPPAAPASGVPASAAPAKPVLSVAQVKPVVPPLSAMAPPPAPVVAATPVSATSPVEKRVEAPVAATSEVPSLIAPAADNSTEELKKQTARLQEQLSSMLFSETPAPPPKPDQPILQLDAIAMSEATANIFELATSGIPAPASNAQPPVTLPAKPAEPISPAPVARNEKAASFLHEEVSIPAWLEPLARNAATSTPIAAPPVVPPAAPQVTAPVVVVAPPAPSVAELVEPSPALALPEITELEDAQVATESYDFASKKEVEFAPANETQAPSFGTSLFESNDSIAEEPAPGGSKKGLWIGAIAATLLLAAAGGAWWYMWQQGQGHAAASTTATVSEPTTQFSSQPQSQPQTQQNLTSAVAPVTDKGFSTPSQLNSQPSTKPAPAVSPATDVQKIAGGKDSSKPASTSGASRAAEPDPQQSAQETRNPTFSKMRLAAPTVKSGNAQTISNEGEPGIAMESGANTSAGALSSALGSHSNQPAAPVPIGGEVTSVQLISSVPPVYPQLARAQRVSGEVKIDALIDESGRVTGMKVVTGPVMLHQAAMDALRQWKYKPATLNGKPVSMHLVVTIQFRLQ